MDRRSFLKVTGALFSIVAVPALAVEIPVKEDFGTATIGTATIGARARINARRSANFVISELQDLYLTCIATMPYNDAISRNELNYTATRVMNYFVNTRVVTQFSVICDETNNPVSVIDANDLRLSVSFKEPYTLAVTTAEFSVLEDFIVVPS